MCEASGYVVDLSEHSSVIWRELKERARLVAIERKKRKSEKIKMKEAEERQKKYDRNMERLKRMESVSK